MRFFFKLILLTLFGLPLILAAAVFLAVDTQPTIDRAAEVTESSIERAKRILAQNDPRKLKSGMRRTVTISSGDLDLAANYLAHRYGGGSARVGLQSGSAQIAASIGVPRLPVSLYFNLDTRLVEQAPLPRLEALRVGRLPVPSWIDLLGHRPWPEVARFEPANRVMEQNNPSGEYHRTGDRHHLRMARKNA